MRRDAEIKRRMDKEVGLLGKEILRKLRSLYRGQPNSNGKIGLRRRNGMDYSSRMEEWEGRDGKMDRGDVKSSSELRVSTSRS